MAEDIVNEEDDFEGGEEKVAPSISDILNHCIRRGMEPPFIVTSVSPSGRIVSIRVRDDGSDPEVLAEHDEPGESPLPVTIMVIDQSNMMATVTFTEDGVTYH